MLGKLAKWLRVLGHDVIYLERAENGEILAGLQEGRILLTRNRRADPWRQHGRVLLVDANTPWEQLREVVRKLSLEKREDRLFSRCLRCNRQIREVHRNEVKEKVPEYIWQTQRNFYRCDKCNRIYWSGSHSERMRQRLQEFFTNLD
jgi:uncharacterized protein with PIN domain